jgi:hypothetical protein
MEHLATEKNGKSVTIDLKDPVYGALAGYAGRIATSLTDARAQADANLAGSLDDFLGVIYSLVQSKQHGFADRTGAIEIKAVEKRAKRISVGEVRTDGKWIAGFYFNNALFRTAAVYHRILKIATGKKTGYMPDLLPIAQKL